MEQSVLPVIFLAKDSRRRDNASFFAYVALEIRIPENIDNGGAECERAGVGTLETKHWKLPY